MNDLDEISDILAKLPPVDERLHAIESYVENLSRFIDFAHAQTKLKMTARARREIDPVTQAEIESEIDRLEENGKFALSAMIAGSSLVSIYFAYEAYLEEFFFVLANEFNLKTHEKFVDENPKKYRRKSFLVTAHEYAINVFRVGIFSSQQHFEIIDFLRTLRNSYVHTGCKLCYIPEKHKNLIAIMGSKKILHLDDNKWSATSKTVEFFFAHIKRSYAHVRSEALQKMLDKNRT